jgi:hypothetical protein
MMKGMMSKQKRKWTIRTGARGYVAERGGHSPYHVIDASNRIKFVHYGIQSSCKAVVRADAHDQVSGKTVGRRCTYVTIPSFLGFEVVKRVLGVGGDWWRMGVVENNDASSL